MEEFYKLCQEHLIEGEIIKDKNTVEIKLKKKFGNKNTISLYISREKFDLMSINEIIVETKKLIFKLEKENYEQQ